MLVILYTCYFSYFSIYIHNILHLLIICKIKESQITFSVYLLIKFIGIRIHFQSAFGHLIFNIDLMSVN